MIYFPIFVSFLTLIFVFFLIYQIKKAPSASGKMIEISQAIREGAIAFLKRQYQTIALLAIFLFLALWQTLGLKTAFGFLLGALASGLAGFIGMMVSTQANVKVTEGSKKGLEIAFALAFKGGAVTGFLVTGLGYS
jgi:K(+)-stimulated pyrophosphate-energized sodium pump